MGTEFLKIKEADEAKKIIKKIFLMNFIPKNQ